MSMMPRQLGKYELQQQLGQGNVGTVWKATDKQAHRDVAIKLFHTDLQSDPHFLTRLQEEGRTLLQLRHANIISVLDVVITRPPQAKETLAYMVMDYVPGPTLTTYIRETVHKGHFPPIEQIVYLFYSLGTAIDYAHRTGVVHGTITPDKIHFDEDNKSRFPAGEPQLRDFGLSRLLSNAGIASDPHYMSPEQAEGHHAGNRSDIYALGVLLYELCTGVQPFRDESSVAVMMQQVRALPTPPALINPNIPPILNEVILRSLAKEPATRYAMATLLAEAIANACGIPYIFPSSRQSRLVEEESSSIREKTSKTTLPILGVAQPTSHTTPHMPISAKLPAATQTGLTGPRPAVHPSSTTGKQPALPPLSEKLPVAPPATSPQTGTTGKTARVTAPQSMQTAKIQAISPDPVSTEKSVETKELPAAVPGTFASDKERTRAYPPTQEVSEGTTNKQPARSQPLPPTHNKVPAPSRSFWTRMSNSRIMNNPIYIVVASVCLLLLLLTCTIGSNLIKGTTQSGTQTGQVFFQDSALGHNDQLHLVLNNVSAPTSGKGYFAWMEDTSHHMHLLGELQVQHGSITYVYAGDAQHTNLLTIINSVFVTQENSDGFPAQPSGSRVYQAMIDTKDFTAIKTLLTALPGSNDQRSAVAIVLDTIKSMNDKAGSIADTMQAKNDYQLVRRQAIRIIEALESDKSARQQGDLTKKDQVEDGVTVGLLTTSSHKGYLDTLDQQVDAVINASADDQTVLAHAKNAKNAITDLRDWLQKIRTYDVQLLKAADLKDPTMIGVALQLKKLAADSYTGRIIPPNVNPTSDPGSAAALQVYSECQYMATMSMRSA